MESGPPPLPLSDGNYVFFHNSANWNSEHKDFESYHPSYVILDGNDPTQILQRADAPMLSPTFGWEFGTKPFECNVHNVSRPAIERCEAATRSLFQPHTFSLLACLPSMLTQLSQTYINPKSSLQVTFLEAAVRVAADTFDVYFGGSDAVVGTARIRVTPPSTSAQGPGRKVE